MVIYGVKYNYTNNQDNEAQILENTLSTNFKSVQQKADDLNMWNTHDNLYFYAAAIAVNTE